MGKMSNLSKICLHINSKMGSVSFLDMIDTLKAATETETFFIFTFLKHIEVLSSRDLRKMSNRLKVLRLDSEKPISNDANSLRTADGVSFV